VGRAGDGISRDCVVEAFKCRGNDEEDHHSRNLRRNMDVGRIKVNDDVSVGRRVVRKKVKGERVREVFPAKDFDGGRVYVNFCFMRDTVSCGPNRCIRIPIILNSGL
jgi:hypothetical protein